MLALQSYEQASGFSVLTADELYYVNGGSITVSQFWTAVSIVTGVAGAVVTGGASLYLTAISVGAGASAFYADVKGI